VHSGEFYVNNNAVFGHVMHGSGEISAVLVAADLLEIVGDGGLAVCVSDGSGVEWWNLFFGDGSEARLRDEDIERLVPQKGYIVVIGDDGMDVNIYHRSPSLPDIVAAGLNVVSESVEKSG